MTQKKECAHESLICTHFKHDLRCFMQWNVSNHSFTVKHKSFQWFRSEFRRSMAYTPANATRASFFSLVNWIFRRTRLHGFPAWEKYRLIVRVSQSTSHASLSIRAVTSRPLLRFSSFLCIVNNFLICFFVALGGRPRRSGSGFLRLSVFFFLVFSNLEMALSLGWFWSSASVFSR